MVYSIDKEGRLNIPDGLVELSIGLSTKKVVLADEGSCKFRLIPMEDIPDDAKIIAGPMTFDDKRRVILPKQLREKCSSAAEIYVMARKLYIEFKEV
ncbi:MAG: hypothetical protein IJX99_06375 [Clostridia bacterium]|nr:hypothetical protein [Clostridia bacterium]